MFNNTKGIQYYVYISTKVLNQILGVSMVGAFGSTVRLNVGTLGLPRVHERVVGSS